MKKAGLLLGLLLSIFSVNAAVQIRHQLKEDVDSLYTKVDFNDLEQLFYASETPNLRILFNDSLRGYTVSFEGNPTSFKVDSTLVIEGLERGDHSVALTGVNSVGEEIEISRPFKVKAYPPFIKNDAVVLGVLMLVLFFVFRTASSERPFLKKFYKVVPALLLCYFIPAGLNSVGLISSEESSLYYIASRYLLPASLILLCLSIDIPAIKRLGSKAIIMFFAATVGIVLGGPLALWLVSLISPEVLNGEIWRGLSTVAGSWIGGGANQTAMKEIYGASDQLFSAMIVVGRVYR